MEILIIICTIAIHVYFAYFYAKREKKKKEKNDFKNTIKDFTVKFLKPLINEKIKYQIHTPIDIEKAKIYMKLLKEEFNTNIIDFDFKIKDLLSDDILRDRDIALKKIESLDYATSWNILDSLKYLNEVYFDLLFKKFVRQFAKDNPDCINEWNSIKNAYIQTFCFNLEYLSYIKEYNDRKSIVTSFENTIENLEKDILKSLEELSLERKTLEYKNAMNNNQFYGDNIFSIEDIDSMNGVEFEKFLEKLFKLQNYKVGLTKSSGDQGADLIVEKFNEKKVIQAKRYNSTVSNKSVQEAVAAINYYNADSAIVITNNYFTKGAIELAKANNVELWDRDKLTQMLLAYPVVLDEIS